MTMVLAYGAYRHPEGTVAPTIERATKYSNGMQPEATIETWTIDGTLYGNGAAAIDSLLSQLIGAYNVLGQDLIWYREDGVTPSQHVLRASDTIDGQLRIKVLPSFPEGRGVEYVNKRKYKIVVEAELPLPAAGFIYHDYKEKLSFTGGGPVYGWVQCAVGAPEYQTWRQQSTYTVVQSGHAIGYLGVPPVPDPIWPAYERTHLRRGDEESPKKVGNGYTEYPVWWEYHFESDVPLIGQPTLAW